MRHSRAAFSFLILTTLCGCPTVAQRQFQAMKSGNQAAVAELDACAAAVYNSPENTPLRSHLPLKIGDLTLEQLSDNSMITPDEWKTVLAVHPQTQQCRRAYLEALSKSEPTAVPILTTQYNQSDDDLLALSAHKLTWGQYVTRARDRAAKTQTALQAEGERIMEGLKRDHAVEMEQRQRAAEAVAAWAQTQE